MTLGTRRALAASAALLFFASLYAFAQPAERALDRYVAEPDPAYKYELAKETSGRGFRHYMLKMTSQSWLTEEEVAPVEWWHWVNITVPTQIKHDTALLFIGGGSNNDVVAKVVDEQFRQVAESTGAIVAEIRLIPNQPLQFKDDGELRSEDALIAHAWVKYLETGDPKWLPRLPMTKAVVRAMDTISEFCGEHGKPINKFIVAGGSKRGWTTWTTAAVDKRVIAIAPMVIDVLNIEPSMTHHYRSYGFWSDAIGDYEEAGVMDWLGTEQFRNLAREVDPYSFRDRFTMPKFLINSAGDQFFLPDSAQFYFDDLPGEKLLRYIPNSDHSLRGTDAIASFTAWAKLILNGTPRPKFSWVFPEDGGIILKVTDRPIFVNVWAATNRLTRDFRADTISYSWMSRALMGKTDEFKVGPPAPDSGWIAYFMELNYENGLKFTTPVRVTPDTLPHPAPEPKPRTETAEQ